MDDRIVWINHAGYELQTDELRIVFDPWISGTAFSDGWGLISESRYRPEDFRGVDYIWLSHEHPDHFSVGDLKSIPLDVRRSITILFQKTHDKRVISFCKGLEFKVKELSPGKIYNLTRSVSFLVGLAGHDSWSFVRTRTHTYLNMNDCVFKRTGDLDGIKAEVGKVDVLLTQFSYAAAPEEADNPAALHRMADAKIGEMSRQIETFAPKFMLPFASFVWFCAPENFYMNAQASRIGMIHSRFKDQIPTIVLRPGETWTVGSVQDAEAACLAYDADFAAHTAPMAPREPRLEAEELLALASAHTRKIRKDNQIWALAPLDWISIVRPIFIRTTDTGETFRYHLFSDLERAPDDADVDIEMTSGLLGNLFKMGFASDTMAINGRYRQRRPGGFAQLSRNFFPRRYNEHGVSVPLGLLKPDFLTYRLG